MQLNEKISQAAKFIASEFPFKPEIGLVLGTGLGPCADDIENAFRISYSRIPHFPEATVKFHAGNLVLGSLAGRIVVAMQGRYHAYEGHPMRELTLPIRVMHQLGVRTLITTNAVGSMRSQLTPGSIVLIRDHINFMGDNPLIGPYEEHLGERFPDMSEPYSQYLMSIAQKCAQVLNLMLPKVVYAAVSGPSFETPAEIRMLQILGADTIGMSVVPEVLVARQLEMRVLGLSIVTDQSLPESPEAVSHEQVAKIAKSVEPIFKQLLRSIIHKMDSD